MRDSPSTESGHRNRAKRRIRASILPVLGVFGLFFLYGFLLKHPGIFFGHTFTDGRITLHSDEPIPSGSAQQVLERVEQCLLRSPLLHSRAGDDIRVYVCNRRWRFVVFANFRYKVGGLTYPPFCNSIFLRAVDFDGDRLIGPSGKAVPGERTLTYFVVHEIMHTLLGNELGAAGYWRLPAWKDEGYSDYIAKGRSFHYDDALAQLRRGDPEMDPKRSGLYLQYNLLVAYLLDRKRISVDELLNQEFDTAGLEAEILAGKHGS
jgi:hypothetical protein